MLDTPKLIIASNEESLGSCNVLVIKKVVLCLVEAHYKKACAFYRVSIWYQRKTFLVVPIYHALMFSTPLQNLSTRRISRDELATANFTNRETRLIK